MKSRLLTDRDRFEERVVPDECPELFCINLSPRLQPIRYALSLGIAITIGKVEENIVVGAKAAVDPFAKIVVALSRPRDRASIDIAEIEIEFAARKSDVGDELVSEAHAGRRFVKILTSSVQVGVHIVDKPRC